MTQKENSIVNSVINLLNHLEQHGDTPIHVNSRVPRGIDSEEWATKYGPLVRVAIKNLLTLTHPTG